MVEKRTDVEKMIPRTATIKFDGVAYTVTRYSVSDLVFFQRELAAAFKSIQTKEPGLEFKNENTIQILALLFDESERLLGLLARAIKKDKEWLEKQEDLAGFSDLFAAVCSVNNFGRIISGFQKGWSALKAQKIKTLKTP